MALQPRDHATVDTLEQVIAETGLSETDLSRLYDLNQPVVPRPRNAPNEMAADEYAPGR